MEIIQTTDYKIISNLNKSVQELHFKLYPEYFKEYNFEEIRDVLKKCIKNPDFIFLIIKDNEQYLGYAWIEIKKYEETAFTKSYSSLFVHQINIVESHTKNGYGSALMEKIYEIAAIHKLKKLELDYWFHNNIAEGFYKKIGFKPYREFICKEV